MKRLLAILVITGLLIVTVAACGGDEEPTPTVAPTTAAAPTEQAAPAEQVTAARLGMRKKVKQPSPPPAPPVTARRVKASRGWAKI